MSIIVFFKTSGVGSSNSSEATDYLLGPHSALTRSLKRQYQLETSGIKFARTAGDFALAELLEIERDKIQGKLREPPPLSLTMNTEHVEYAIGITPHKYKYSSGVVAHAIEDTKVLIENPQIGQEYRELFEHLIFAGLPPEQWLIEWVEHTHEGNIENHFVIPRINLATGKSFNSHYPGSEADFNAVRDYINLKYGLANPMDAERSFQLIKIGKYDPNKKIKQELLSEVLSLMATNIIQNRLHVIDWLMSDKAKSQFNVESVNAQPEFIRLKIKDKKNKTKSIKLKGAFFRQDFTSLEAIRLDKGSDQIQGDLARQNRLNILNQDIIIAIQKRSKFNKNRYEVSDNQILIPKSLTTTEGGLNNESDRKKAVRSDTETRSENNGFNSAIGSPGRESSTASESVRKGPSFFSVLIGKLTRRIKRFIGGRREKRDRVKQHIKPIADWVSQQQRLNVEVHRACQSLEEQIEQTSLNTERRRIKMKMNVLLYDFNKANCKRYDAEKVFETGGDEIDLTHNFTL